MVEDRRISTQQELKNQLIEGHFLENGRDIYVEYSRCLVWVDISESVKVRSEL